MDDGFIYIYPLEIKDTLSALNNHNGFELNGEKYKWYLRDIIPTKIIEYLKQRVVPIKKREL
jgi:hypothetical protein